MQTLLINYIKAQLQSGFEESVWLWNQQYNALGIHLALAETKEDKAIKMSFNTPWISRIIDWESIALIRFRESDWKMIESWPSSRVENIVARIARASPIKGEATYGSTEEWLEDPFGPRKDHPSPANPVSEFQTASGQHVISQANWLAITLP